MNEHNATNDVLKAEAAQEWDRRGPSFLRFYDGAPQLTQIRLAHEEGYVSGARRAKSETAATADHFPDGGKVMDRPTPSHTAQPIPLTGDNGSALSATAPNEELSAIVQVLYSAGYTEAPIKGVNLAELIQGILDSRVPSSASASGELESFIAELSAYAAGDRCETCYGAGCVGIPGAECPSCDGAGKNRLALAFKWLKMERDLKEANDIADRQMADACAARLELAEYKARTPSSARLISARKRKPDRDALLLTTSKVWIIGDWYRGAWRTHRSQWTLIDGVQVLASAYAEDDITHWLPLPDPFTGALSANALRNDIIEECAVEADNYAAAVYGDKPEGFFYRENAAEEVAKAIRALKNEADRTSDS